MKKNMKKNMKKLIKIVPLTLLNSNIKKLCKGQIINSK
jgi:hypothetical protein